MIYIIFLIAAAADYGRFFKKIIHTAVLYA